MTTIPITGQRTLRHTTISDVRAQPIRWMVPNRVPYGGLTVLAGNPGQGKSQLTLGIAAGDAVNVPARDTEGVDPTMSSDLTPRDDVPRKPISKRLRYEILRRDDNTCRYCGGRAPDVKLTIDHVVPVALGGSDDPSNLVAACRDCNAGKSSVAPGSPLVDDVSADAIRWADAMRRAAEDAQANRDAAEAFADEFRDKAWNRWGEIIADDDVKHMPLPDGWRNSIANFRAAGLTQADLLEAVNIMAPKAMKMEDRFRYFCGIAWRMVTERQEAARRIIEDSQ